MTLKLIYAVVFHRSGIEVRNGLTFLDLIVIQIEVSVCLFSSLLFSSLLFCFDFDLVLLLHGTNC